MVNGQMVLKLRNLDQQRSFSGLARVTLTDDSDNNYNDIPPLPLDLKPEEETAVPINDVKQPYGDLMLMVYDQRQTVQMIRSIPYGERPKAAIAENRSETNDGAAAQGREPDEWKVTDNGGDKSPSVEVPGSGQPGLPNVTGTFDATQLSDPSAGAAGDNNSAPQNANGDNSQGGIAVSPRQVSANSDSVMMEVGLNGQQPIGYVKVSIRAGNFQDEKIAVFPTTNASVPFLIPAKDAKGQYTYEVRNDAGKVIGTGVQNFGAIGPDS